MQNRPFLAAALIAALLPLPAAAATPQSAIYPPWTSPFVSGVDFTIAPVDNVPDVYGDVNDPQLVIFFAGNQYMLVNDLLKAFQKAYPQYQRVLAETLPPGILSKQIQNGGLVIGNMRISVKPDIFTAGSGRMHKLQTQNDWFSSTEPYAQNRLAIMTYKGNPEHIKSWQDLENPSLKICMPNPKFEGIAKHAIIPALKKTGGEKLANAIYQTKVQKGTTYLTHIHHRQTPMRIMQRKCAAGAVWYTEAHFHADMVDHPIAMVTIPDSQNKTVTYTAGIMRSAPHPQAAKDFLGFLTGSEGQGIYQRYGFLPPPAPHAGQQGHSR